jgi:hypothetical protein
MENKKCLKPPSREKITQKNHLFTCLDGISGSWLGSPAAPMTGGEAPTKSHKANQKKHVYGW